MSRYPYVDRNPCIVAAGKPIGDPYADVKDLFHDVRLQDKVDAIRNQFGFVDTKDYAGEWIKPPEPDVSGAFTEIRHCLRRPMPTGFQAIDEEVKSTIYDSYWNKPLGKSRDQTPGLPKGFAPLEVSFGKSTKSSESASMVVNPPKPAEQVTKEDEAFHTLYSFTHQDFYPGEQIKRSYDPPFNEYNFFGKPSKKDESGARVKRCLTWFNNDPISNVSRRQAAVRNRTLPPLGKALDKTGVTDLFPPEHAYGKENPPNFYGVEDLLNECTPSLLRRDMLIFLAYANKIRQFIYNKIQSGELELEELYEEISSLNKDKEDDDCTVNFDCVDRVLKRHSIFLDRSKIEPLLLMLGLIKDGQIKVRDFINFIDKNSRFPALKKDLFILPPEFQNYNRTYRSEFEKPRDLNRIRKMTPAGAPSVRTDKPYPIFKDSIVNMDHLSEETTARTLISPSIYTQYGLSHRDFFKPRSKDFLDKLFRKINVTLPEDELDEIYKEGYELDKTGGVCVETFRNLLDDRAYKAYNRMQ